MPIRSLVFALACLAAPALAFAAKWEKVGDAGPVAVYVDKASVRRTGTDAWAQREWRWARLTESAPCPSRPRSEA